jgi:hypothetical protein
MGLKSMRKPTNASALPSVSKTPPQDFAPNQWPQIGGRPGCFFGEITLPKNGHIDLGPLCGARLHLFGGSHEESYQGRMVKAPRFALVEKRAGGKVVETHCLFQDQDVFFASKTEHDRLAALPPEDPQAHFEDPVWKERFELTSEAFGVLHDALKTGDICSELEDRLCADYERAGKPKGRKKWLKERLLPEYRWLKARPRWVEDEGEWPAFLGRQMLFIGQFAVPDNDVSEEYGLGGTMVYLFAGWSGNQVEFKILSQDAGEQTAEQHYQAEAIMALFLQSPKEPKILRRCVKEGDKYVHEFLLEQPGLGPEGLKLLAEKGANKIIREEAQRRLKA